MQSRRPLASSTRKFRNARSNAMTKCDGFAAQATGSTRSPHFLFRLQRSNGVPWMSPHVAISEAHCHLKYGGREASRSSWKHEGQYSVRQEAAR